MKKEPREVTGPDGLKRWVGDDGRSYDTIEQASAAQPISEVSEVVKARQLRLFHLTTDSAFLQWPKSAWVKAEDPQRAAVLWLQAGGGGPGNINVFDYLWNWHAEPEGEGGVTLEYISHRVAVFTVEQQQQLLDQSRRE
jgi:hypothetical protein